MRLRTPRRPVLKTISVLPTLVTAGNLLAGTLALVYLQEASSAPDAATREGLWNRAAWMIFLGMFCDALDGRLARLTRSTSAFGAQLDSLADVVTFGVAPALLARSLLAPAFPWIGPRLLTALVAVHVVGAALRLARYNVESARLEAAGAAHVTLVFRGLPSPAAAGVIASLVLLRHAYGLHAVDWAILVATPAMGLLMISRLPYPHLINRFLDGNRPIYGVALLVMTLFLFLAYLLETITAAFVSYALSGPVLMGLARSTGRPAWALREEQDEAAAAPVEEGASAREPGAEGEPPRPDRRGRSVHRWGSG